MKMRLHATTTSPYVRKVLIAAYEKGLWENIELIPTNPHVDEYLRRDNPLCKVPTLLLENGEPLFDSPVICEYLDSLREQPRLFPTGGMERWRALRLLALGDGILDATLSRRMEILRPKSEQSPEWIERWILAASASLDWLEQRVDLLTSEFNIGQIAIACALIHVGFRFPEDEWQRRRPALSAWFQRFSERPSINACSYEELSKLPSSQIKPGGPVPA